MALSEGQFVPFFQPLIQLRTGQIIGFEVLARWHHPTEGLIPPDRFIPAAERDGWIGELTKQLLRRAFIAVSELSDTLTLAMNVSPLQLRDASLPEQFSSMAKEADFSLSRLIVEVTESALIDDLSGAARFVAELKARGCKLALDDFGTGYSSLSHFQALPFDELKVDQSFVGSMMEKRESRKIVSAVVGLGQSLGLTTVAEGIETQDQAEMLLRLGCEIGQGYYFGRPMPAEHLPAAVFAHREKIQLTNPASKKTPDADSEIFQSRTLARLRAVYDGAPIGLALVDQDLRLLNINQKLADMSRTPLEAYLGSPLSDAIPDFFPGIEPDLRRALAGEIIKEVELQATDPEQTWLLSYRPALDEAGEVVGIAIAVQEITRQQRMETTLGTIEAQYRSMLELDPQFLWIMDPQGHLLDSTPRWDKATGFLTQESSDWLTSVHPADLQATIRTITEARRTESPIDVEYRVADGFDGWRWKRSRGSPRFNISGEVVCWCGSVQDIDAPHHASQDVLNPRESSYTAYEPRYAKSSMNSTETEKRTEALLELEILDTPAEAEFDDIVVLASEICQAPVSMVSLVTSDRQWFKASIGTPLCETPINVSFCAHAIQQRGLFLVEDATKDERFMDNPLVVDDPHVRFYAGVPLYAGQGVAVGSLCVVDMVPRTLSPGQAKALAILAQQVQTQLDLRWERKKLLKAAEENQNLAKRLQVSNNTLLEANSRLQELATTDVLTGLLNRRAFEEKISQEFATAQLGSQSLSLLILDIDDFKKRNDELGHAAGDEALRFVGEGLQKALRPGHSAARIGGEEFAILLPETTLSQAAVIGKRIQAILGLGRADLDPVYVSIGYSCLRPDVLHWQALFTEADREMYKAKRTVKNRPVILDDRQVA